MRSAKVLILVAALVCLAGRAFAVGEVITDIRVRDNIRTQEEVIRSIAGINIGEILEVNTLDIVRERLNSTGLFADVDVYWEAYRDGVRVNIVVKDKFPWAPVPTFSYSPGNVSGGLLLAHGNLFGRGKRGVIGGRLSTVDSGALVAYQDPALFGSWAFWQVQGRFQDRIIPEYGNVEELPVSPVRETRLRQYGFAARAGVAWFRRVKTAVEYTLDKTEVRNFNNGDAFLDRPDLGPGTDGGIRSVGEAIVSFDFRAYDQAILSGNALTFDLQRGSPRLGGDEKFNYWKAFVEFEQGLRLFRRQNFILRATAIAGTNLPLWAENSLGGANLRGYVYRQFSGDTQLSSQAEYHFPLFKLWEVQVRGLVFSDGAAIWFRELPKVNAGGSYEVRKDGRSFLPEMYLVPGFDPHRDIHGSAGVGLRFFIKSIAVPLVGVDVGRGFEPDAPFRMVLVIGA